ncbi:unnamed protein product [Polarella glacialis]|uniref:Uncharacterized protein n=1 Tax=Polarella glacialis TaxID=89957 RepID=A0A813JLI8_POLGL|nr:unnamed protein product [Polarella glacialis]
MLDAMYVHMFDCWAERFLSSQTQQPLHVSCLDLFRLVHVDGWKTASQSQLASLGAAGLEVSSEQVPQAAEESLLQTSADMHASSALPQSYKKSFYPELQALLQTTGGDVLHTDIDAM